MSLTSRSFSVPTPPRRASGVEFRKIEIEEKKEEERGKVVVEKKLKVNVRLYRLIHGFSMSCLQSDTSPGAVQRRDHSSTPLT